MFLLLFLILLFFSPGFFFFLFVGVFFLFLFLFFSFLFFFVSFSFFHFCFFAARTGTPSRRRASPAAGLARCMRAGRLRGTADGASYANASDAPPKSHRPLRRQRVTRMRPSDVGCAPIGHEVLPHHGVKRWAPTAAAVDAHEQRRTSRAFRRRSRARRRALRWLRRSSPWRSRRAPSWYPPCTRRHRWCAPASRPTRPRRSRSGLRS